MSIYGAPPCFIPFTQGLHFGRFVADVNVLHLPSFTTPLPRFRLIPFSIGAPLFSLSVAKLSALISARCGNGLRLFPP